MLGINKNHTPITGKSATEIRQVALRMATGNLNNEDRATRCRGLEDLNRYKAKWEI